MPPEIARALDEMAEIAVDDWQEQRHAHEVSVNDICDGCGKPWNSEYHFGRTCISGNEREDE